MEVNLPALLGNYNRPTDQLTDQLTDRPGKREVSKTAIYNDYSFSTIVCS